MNPKLLIMLAGVWLGMHAPAIGTVADTGPIPHSSFVFPVDKTIRGVVKDAEDGQTIPGVNVMLKGTQNGTVTDMDGAFQLTVPDDASTLMVSFVGYLSKEVSIGNQGNLEILLEQDVQNLDEVVVVGYGTARKRDLTGAVSRVGEEGFNKGVNVSPDQLIQGKVAGVDIINNSGAPGGQVTFRIRGTSSVRSGNQPLFVVDGVPLDGRNTKPGATAGELGSTEGSNPLNFINPNDIESIDVLKDASATAIYGSRGANGVVIITTKKGKSGAPKVTVDMSTAVSTMVRRPDIMDGDTYRQALQHRGIEGNNGGDAVDAFDEITQTALTNRLNLSVSGGGEKNNYRLSLGYHDQEGVVKESGLKKYTASYTTSYRFLPEDRVKLDVSLIASNTVEQGAPIAENSNVNGSLIGNAIEWNPTVPFRYADGSFVQRIYNQEGYEVAGLSTNPAALLAYYNDKSNVTNILGNVALTVNIIDGLDYRFSIGVNHAKGNRTVDTSGELFLSTITDLGLAISNSSTLTSQTLNHTLNYKKDLGKVHLNALLGYEFQDYKSYVNNISARGFTSFDVFGTDILQNPSRENVGVSSFRDPTNQLQSFFGRVNLNFSDRFLLTGTMRADGSTKFGENNKYGYFPSFAGAWVLSEEGFLKSSNLVDNLKFRVGWGITGNQEFPAGASQERYAFGNQQISLVNVANPDLKWETTETVNIGLDFSLFRSRLMGSLEYFDKATTDLLFQLPTIQPAPAAQFWTNVPATVRNRGMELMLSTIVADSEKLLWEVGMNATYLSNELTNYDGAPVWTGQINGNGLGGGSNSQQLVNDHPLNVFKMLRFEGFDEDGEALYSAQEEFVGDPNPNFLLGVNTRLDYGKFGFNMSLNGAFGHQIYNNTANAYLTAANFGLGRNSSPEIGLGNESLANANVVSTRFLEEGNFLRLQNASVSYNLGGIGQVVSNLRFSLTGQNLFLITNYSGFDPEVNTNRSVDGVPSYGIEYAPYPRARTFLLGVSASF
ncbi:TonB-dependent receptor [Echinicola soli]|uniref:TonB-dependent receptor n=1 Tax=Echinicola soli TaxID=2591634 RepID=A0A514CGM8_9BACT|nr:TonB-dependent receptor [Echinicola soli]QDH78979.1 TonB-dependent receptor [Echinicola soli]